MLHAGETLEILRFQTGEYLTATGAAYAVVQRDSVMCDEPATALMEPMLTSAFAGTRFIVDGLKQQHDVDDGPIRAGDFVYELFASCLQNVCELQIGGIISTSVSSGSMERVDLTTRRLMQHFPDGPVEIVSSAPLVAALHAFPLTIPHGLRALRSMALQALQPSISFPLAENAATLPFIWIPERPIKPVQTSSATTHSVVILFERHQIAGAAHASHQMQAALSRRRQRQSICDGKTELFEPGTAGGGNVRNVGRRLLRRYRWDGRQRCGPHIHNRRRVRPSRKEARVPGALRS